MALKKVSAYLSARPDNVPSKYYRVVELRICPSDCEFNTRDGFEPMTWGMADIVIRFQTDRDTTKIYGFEDPKIAECDTRKAAKTLRWWAGIERKLEKLRERFGSCETWETFVMRLTDAVKPELAYYGGKTISVPQMLYRMRETFASHPKAGEVRS
jgi:hypothetical protein